MMQNISEMHIQDGGRPVHLEDTFCIIMRYRDFSIFKMAAVRHLGFFKLKFLTAVHFIETRSTSPCHFLEIGLAEISQFFVFFPTEM